MKKITLLVILALAGATVLQKSYAQNALHVSAEAGAVLKTNKDKSLGVGGTIGVMVQDNFFFIEPTNYLTFSVKGFNNPYGDGKIISSIFNKESDGFNYIAFLLGYRMTQDNFSDGWFFEPRFGYAAGSLYGALIFAPVGGYAYKDFDFGAFLDLGFGEKNSAIGSKNFYTLGITVGYNLRF